MSYERNETYNEETVNSLKENYTNIIESLGEDAHREGLLKTPERIAKAMLFNTQGYGQDAIAILNSAKFREDIIEMTYSTI